MPRAASRRLLRRAAELEELPRQLEPAVATGLDDELVEAALRRAGQLAAVDAEPAVVARAQIVALPGIPADRAAEVRAHRGARVDVLGLGADSPDPRRAENDVARGNPGILDDRRDDLDTRRRRAGDEAVGVADVDRLL